MSPEIIRKLKYIAAAYFVIVIFVIVSSQENRGIRAVDKSLLGNELKIDKDVVHPDSGKILVKEGTEIDKDALNILTKNNIEEVDVRGRGKVIGVNANAILVILNFISLVVILYYLLWKKVLDALEERREKIESDISDGEKQKEEAEKLKSRRDKELTEARDTKDDIISKAKNEADSERERILNDAKSEADQLIEDANRNIETMERNLRGKLLREVAGYSADMAGKLIGKNISEEDSKALTEKYISSLGAADE